MKAFFRGIRSLFVFLPFLGLVASLAGCSSFATQKAWPQGLTNAEIVRLRQAPVAVRPWPAGGTGGVVIQTTHYRIYTTLRNPVERVLISRVVEAAYQRFVALVPHTRIHSPLIGYIFRNRRQWTAHVRATAGSLASVYLRIEEGGYEQTGQFVIWRTSLSEMLSVLAHECWHQLSYRSLKNHLPAWLDEGLATQNEIFFWRHGRPVFTPWLNRPRWDALRAAYVNHEFLPLNTLASTQAGEIITQSAGVVRAYYAEVWSFMLYLKHSRYRPRLLALLHAAHDGQLNRWLAKSGLSQKDIALQTVRWNSIAGPLFLHDCITLHDRTLQRRYLRFVQHLLATWPPHPPMLVGHPAALMPQATASISTALGRQ